jgi:hypothetical protein
LIAFEGYQHFQQPDQEKCEQRNKSPLECSRRLRFRLKINLA